MSPSGNTSTRQQKQRLNTVLVPLFSPLIWNHSDADDGKLSLQTYYVTLDFTVPELEIRQPSALTGVGTSFNNQKWKNPLSEALSHATDRKMTNLAIPYGEDEDEDFRPVFQDQTQKRTAATKTKRRAPLREFFPSPMDAIDDGNGKEDDKGDDTEKENENSSREQDRSDADETRIDPDLRMQQHVQVLGFHDYNPVFRYNGRTYIGEWSEVLGTDMVFAKNVRGDRFPILRNLQNSVDLVAASAARIQATEVEFTKKDDLMAAGETDVKDKKGKFPAQHLSTAHHYTSEHTYPSRPRRKRRTAGPPLVDNELETVREEQRREEEAKHLSWLQKFQAIKREMGETDTVPLLVTPADNDRRSEKRREISGLGKQRKNLYAGYEPEDFEEGFEDDEEADGVAGTEGHFHTYHEEGLNAQGPSRLGQAMEGVQVHGLLYGSEDEHGRRIDMD